MDSVTKLLSWKLGLKGHNYATQAIPLGAHYSHYPYNHHQRRKECAKGEEAQPRIWSVKRFAIIGAVCVQNATLSPPSTTSGVSCRREMGWNGPIILIYMMYIQRLGRPFDPRTTKALNGWRPRRRRRSESYSSHHIISTIVEWRSHQKGFNYRNRNLVRLLPLSKTFFTIRDKNGQNGNRNTGKKRIRKQCQDQEEDFFWDFLFARGVCN